MNKKKFKKMNAGRSLKMLMASNDVSCDTLEKALGVSSTTMTLLRKKTLMSGKNVVSLSDYFGIDCSEFISIGEE